MVFHQRPVKEGRNFRQIQDVVTDGDTDPPRARTGSGEDSIGKVVQGEVGILADGNDAGHGEVDVL